jgi:hypothetical protein
MAALPCLEAVIDGLIDGQTTNMGFSNSSAIYIKIELAYV